MNVGSLERKEDVRLKIVRHAQDIVIEFLNESGPA